MNNKYCSVSNLNNEADVEAFLILPFLQDLGFEHKHIKPKKSLQELSVKTMASRRAVMYRPDFAIKIGKYIRMIVEAKAPTESLDSHVLQARDYCATLNGEHIDRKPVQFYLLSNGHLTRLYKADYNEPIVEVRFGDFQNSSNVYKKIISLIGIDSLSKTEFKASLVPMLELRKAPLKDVNEAFAWCHQYIYKTDNISQGAAFMEFVKIIALKLLSDRHVRDNYKGAQDSDVFHVPLSEVRFSKALLSEQQKHTPNPLSTIWFSDFIKEMEHEIATKKKKRIFEPTDQINLSPETISGVVEKLEGLFLFGIDADLNGRLFETFLSATMRGKDLGQYFTPRSIVKLGVGLARLKVNPTTPDLTDRVYDGCCGTGGFLIDVLADMWEKTNKNSAISEVAKEGLRHKIANEHIYGADIGRDPNLSRIGRLNMYLHGDGGSSIYNVDALDKNIPDNRADKPELAEEKSQMRDIGNRVGGFFDVVITNPPFAKKYSLAKAKSKDEESTASRILGQYVLRSFDGGKARSELRSNLMFMERYCDLLKKGGRLITVIDDGILSGKDYAWFRSWLRQEFLINAVVSLPGDAFQRSMARVKTSYLVLTKKTSESETQPNVFMYPCIYVGIDDPARARTLPIDAKNRDLAKQEITDVLIAYEDFLSGKKSIYSVDSSKVADRLDVKHCFMEPGSNISTWVKSGLNIIPLSEAVEPKRFDTEDVLDCASHAETETPLIVRYDGSSEAGSQIFPAETQHARLYRVAAGDIVISNIAASYGSISVVPEELGGCVVSSEYTVLTSKAGFEPRMLWAILRSPVVLSEILLVATGANRTRVKWDAIENLMIPYPIAAVEAEFVSSLMKADREEKTARKAKHDKIEQVITDLQLHTVDADTILAAFKPPK
ncbi:N-6 DNA methylase [Pseudomonas syringae]|nr:N-6 DNA methylase [Pseudomonas syringae]